MPTHEYLEVTIPLPARVTSHVDQLGNLRLRVNKRDLTRIVAIEVQDRLHDAGVEVGKALHDEDAKKPPAGPDEVRDALRNLLNEIDTWDYSYGTHIEPHEAEAIADAVLARARKAAKS